MKNIWKWACFILIPNTLLSIYSLKWVMHTYEVREQIELCLGDLRDAETGVRGLIISKGDTKFLKPYSNALQKIPAKFDRLQLLVSDNPRQQEKIKLLCSESLIKFKILNEVLNANQKGHTDEMTALIYQGKQVMDNIRELIRQMSKEETRLMLIRLKNAKYTYYWMIGSVVVLFLALLIQSIQDYWNRKNMRHLSI